MAEVKAKKVWYKKWWVWALIVFIGFPAIGTLVGGGEEDAKPAAKPKVEEKAEAKPSKKEKETKKKKDDVKVTEFGIRQAVELTTADDLVHDAAVEIDDGTIYIAITAPAVNEDYAKELGDNMVRQLATFSEGEGPTKDYYGEIYEKYDLHVGVFGHNQKEIAYGTKITVSDKIRWK
ncbi:hypothetical protein [Rossellomorea marisflavi]|uniref:hypothetical protein n=1 Tax=Rossellomorea marisflavi TaxID=189381 RepID=UPI00064ED7E0|nr:hypothetical protein [Rossellomorea marisflavi]KMK93736.1 hypothetical protein VL03_12770 [Rossellomorea marisflavi]